MENSNSAGTISTIVIAATNSGAGKTSISLGLARAFMRRALKVQTFKAGPDFLDPTYLAMASGRTCYNLDSWMMDREYLLQLFSRAAADADIAIVEGVMGLFDGSSPDSLEGSTAEVAAILDAPVILIGSAHGMSRSFAAMVQGFAEFEKSIDVAGVIANRCGSDRHRQWLRQSLTHDGLPSLTGTIAKQEFPELPSRHLGLVSADKRTLRAETMDRLADICEQGINMEGLLEIASRGSAIRTGRADSEPTAKRVRLGVAFDEAFHFYYPDNLEALRRAGCEEIRFSPLEDDALPTGLDGIYIGGGYPEVYVDRLSANESMRSSIAEFAASNKPIYAECGGLMYLGEALIDKQGIEHPMVGLLDIRTGMLDRFKSLGYVEVELREDCLWGRKGTTIRGHEFHYSEIKEGPGENSGLERIYSVKRRSGSVNCIEGFRKNNILATYMHLHFASRAHTVENFVKTLENAREKKEQKDLHTAEQSR